MRFALLLLACVLFACADPDVEGGPVITARDPTCMQTRVFGGVLDDDACGSDAVVQVFTPDIDNGASCTGALVSRNLVLTAHHCVASMPVADLRCGNGGRAPRFAPKVAASSVSIRFGYNGTKRDEAKVKEIILPSDDGLCGADIALLILAEDIPLSIAEPLKVRLDEPVRMGESIKAVGYGLRENGMAGLRHRDRQAFPVLRTGPADGTKDGRPALAPYEIETGPAFCQGDSGGPAIETESGEIVAVISRFSAPKKDPAQDCKNATGFFYTGVAGYAHLFERARLAGAAWKEAKPKAPQMLGADCSSGDACASKLCGVDGKTEDSERTFCTAGCTPGGTDCPNDWTCEPMDRAVTRSDREGICAPRAHGELSMRTAPRARVQRMQTTEGYNQGCATGGSPGRPQSLVGILLAVSIVVRRRVQKLAGPIGPPTRIALPAPAPVSRVCARLVETHGDCARRSEARLHRLPAVSAGVAGFSSAAKSI